MKGKILQILGREKINAVDNLERARMAAARGDKHVLEGYLARQEQQLAEIIDCINWVKER